MAKIRLLLVLIFWNIFQKFSIKVGGANTHFENLSILPEYY